MKEKKDKKMEVERRGKLTSVSLKRVNGKKKIKLIMTRRKRGRIEKQVRKNK